MEGTVAGQGTALAESFPAYFINQPVLWMAALAAIPVILHFLLRHKPRKLIFPALRLLQLRKKTNIRRLRLKHIWLLLLRIAVIVLLVLAIARPTLPSANYSPNGREWTTLLLIAAVALGTYFGLLYRWRKQKLANHAYVYRRSWLRGGTGLGVLLLMLLLFVWPYSKRVFAEIEAPLPEVAKDLPVSAVFLVDDGLTMGYTLDSRSRLQEATDIAVKHLESLNRGSQVAVATPGGNGQVLFQNDLVAVKDRLQKLRVNPLGRHRLDQLLSAAVKKQERDRQQILKDFEADRYLREIYVFTDLSANAWQKTPSSETRALLEKDPWLQVYVIDVGVKDPADAAVSEVALTEQSVVKGGELFVDVKLRAVGPRRVTRRVKLSFMDERGKYTITKGQATLALEPGTEISHRFTLGSLDGPFRQGVVQFESPDWLEADDRRYFTVAVHPPPNVLIVSDSYADAYLWKEMLSPDGLPQDQRWFHSEYLPASRLAETNLSTYDVVYLINVARPSAAMWTALGKYVRNGGGLGVSLGMPNPGSVSTSAYGQEPALAILPAKPLAQLKFFPPEKIELTARTDPIFANLVKFPNDFELQSVQKYWKVKPQPGAKVLARYTDEFRYPALVARPVEKGRTLLLSTSVRGDGDWNDLRFSGWAFQDLAHRITQFLAGHAGRTYNFQRGDVVRLFWDRSISARPEMLKRPGTQVAIDARQGHVREESRQGKSISLDPALLDEVGNYRLLGEGELLAGFAYNVRPEQSDLTRLTDEQLDAIFGRKRYQIAHDTESLNRIVRAGRVGEEFFSIVLVFLLIVFAGEHFVANRFYEADQAAEHR